MLPFSRPTSPPLPAIYLILVMMITLLLGSSLHGQSLDSILTNLPAKTWHRVPNSALRPVTPPNGFGGKDYDFRFHSVNIIGAWSGGTYDTKRNRMIIWGGGHNDYYGNELYVFDLATAQWLRLNDPDLDFELYMDCFETHASGNPRSRHTYGGLEYIEHADRFWAYGGSLACGSGSSSSKTWVFDFDQMTWTDLQPTGTAPSWDNLQEYSIYDPSSGLIYLFWHGQLFRYDYDANTWEQLDDDQVSWSEKGCAIDHSRDLLVEIGDGLVGVWDLNNGGTFSRQIWTTTSADQLVSSRAPGLQYDPVADRMVAWNYGSDIYELDLDSRQWTTHVLQGGPDSVSLYVYGRFQYIPDYNVYIAISHIDEDVYFYKHTAGGGTSTADVQLTSTSLSLYPNPTQDIFEIKGLLEAYEISILDASGNLYQTIATTGTSVDIDLQDLPAGMYFVSIVNATNQLISMQKMLKTN